METSCRGLNFKTLQDPGRSLSNAVSSPLSSYLELTESRTQSYRCFRDTWDNHCWPVNILKFPDGTVKPPSAQVALFPVSLMSKDLLFYTRLCCHRMRINRQTDWCPPEKNSSGRSTTNTNRNGQDSSEKRDVIWQLCSLKYRDEDKADSKTRKYLKKRSNKGKKTNKKANSPGTTQDLSPISGLLRPEISSPRFFLSFKI